MSYSIPHPYQGTRVDPGGLDSIAVQTTNHESLLGFRILLSRHYWFKEYLLSELVGYWFLDGFQSNLGISVHPAMENQP